VKEPTADELLVFEAIFEGAPDAMILCDDEGTCVQANAVATALYGLRAGELVGRAVVGLAGDHPSPEGEWRRLLGAGSVKGEFRLTRADGTTRHVEYSARTHVLPGRHLGILRDVTDRRVAEEERDDLLATTIAMNRELDALSRHVVDVQERERRLLARELHDELGQLLTALTLMLDAGSSPPRLDAARALVREMMDRVRDLSASLSPPGLDVMGLVPALAAHGQRHELQTGVHVRLLAPGEERRFDPAVELAAFRIVQEALTNVAKHAGVREAFVEVTVVGHWLAVRIEDHGTGNATAAGSSGTGLAGMRERARLAGGQIALASTPGRGTRIDAVFPIRQASA
jgi:PAS domain S-box-containing protein